MVKRRGPPSQGWRTFLRNHASNTAAMDLLVVPIFGLSLLYAFVMVGLRLRNCYCHQLSVALGHRLRADL